MEPIVLDDPTGRSSLRFMVMSPRGLHSYPTLSIICNFEKVRYGVGGYHTAMQLLLTPDHARDTLRELLSGHSFVSIQGDLHHHGHVEYEDKWHKHEFRVYTPNAKRAFRRYTLGHLQNLNTIVARLLEALDTAEAADPPKPQETPSERMNRVERENRERLTTLRERAAPTPTPQERARLLETAAMLNKTQPDVAEHLVEAATATPEREPVSVSSVSTCSHCGLAIEEGKRLAARIAELTEELTKAHQMIAFLKQYAPH